MTTISPTDALNGMATRGATEYDAPAKFMHWLAVLLILAEFPIGWLMPPTGRGEVPAAAVNLHFTFGMMILALFTVRFIWRLAHPVPMEASLPEAQKRIAHAAHTLLYGLVFATLFAGWAHASVRGWPIKLFGLVPVPPICAKGSEIGHLIGSFHKTFGLLFLVLIAIHVTGVLYHHLVQGDRILARTLPRDAKAARRPARALV